VGDKSLHQIFDGNLNRIGEQWRPTIFGIIMKFSINFSSKKTAEKEVCLGVIRIGEFQEQFISEVTFWKKRDYERHWSQALARIVNGRNESCLITSITDPKKSNFIRWWLIYRRGDTLHFQNQIHFLDPSGIFDPDAPVKFVPPRTTVSESGDRISEWRLPLIEVEKFVSATPSGLR
jgi:contact-dependent growth inhibition (CDI) system CdiI-like immunity protein